MNHKQDRMDAVQWARRLLFKNGFVVLDTETTGLRDAQTVQIAVMSSGGQPLMDTLVMPTCEITQKAQQIHGISLEMLREKQAPTFDLVYPKLAALLKGQNVVIYNVEYDWPIILSQCAAYKLPVPEVNCVTCAMEWYAQYYGDWDEYHESYTWQKLPDGDHSALGDCRATLDLIKRMAQAIEVGS